MNRIEEMNRLGIKQVDLLIALRERGIVVQPPELSNALRGITTYPKSKRIAAEVDYILREKESQSCVLA